MLTRPMPRSAWVLGRFSAYVLVATAILGTSLFLTFAAATALADFGFDADGVEKLATYALAMFMALLANGALALFLGAVELGFSRGLGAATCVISFPLAMGAIYVGLLNKHGRPSLTPEQYGRMVVPAMVSAGSAIGAAKAAIDDHLILSAVLCGVAVLSAKALARALRLAQRELPNEPSQRG